MIYYYTNCRANVTKQKFKEKETKSYKNLVEILKKFSIEVPISTEYELDESICAQMDIMTSSRANMRNKLDKIINLCPEAIVVTDLSVFGENIYQYYELLYNNGIKLLVFDNPVFSTCDEQFNPKDWIQMKEIMSFAKQVNKLETRGRKTDIDDNFINIYWLYELFLISEDIAVKASNLSKNGFHLRANAYERSLRYSTDEKHMEEKYNISEIPARNKSKAGFDNIQQIYMKTNNLNLACIQANSYIFSQIMYQRLSIKNRKSLSVAFKRYDLALMSNFEKTGRLITLE